MLLRVAQSWNMMTPITKGIRKVQCERADFGAMVKLGILCIFDSSDFFFGGENGGRCGRVSVKSCVLRMIF
jgi:hypothetical protein